MVRWQTTEAWDLLVKLPLQQFMQNKFHWESDSCIVYFYRHITHSILSRLITLSLPLQVHHLVLYAYIYKYI